MMLLLVFSAQDLALDEPIINGAMNGA